MRAVSSWKLSLLGAILFLAGSGNGQAQTSSGFFSFMNCSALDGAVMLKIDGDSYRPKGYRPGEFSQGGQLSAGPHTLTVEGEDAEPITLPITVEENASVILLAYSETETKQDGTTKTLMKLIQYPGAPKRSGFHYSAVYVSSQPSASLYINGESIVLPSMKVKPISSKGRLRVSTIKPVAGDEFRQTPESLTFTPDQQGDYLLVVFHISSGEKKFRLMQNIAQ